MSTGVSRACCGSNGGGAALIHQASRTLTDAEIKAWPAASPNAVLLTGAPSSGRVVIPTLGVLSCDFAAPYSNVSTSTQDSRGQIIFVYGQFWDDDALPFWDSGAPSGGLSLANVIADGSYLLFPPMWYRGGGTPFHALSPFHFARGDTAGAEIWVYLFNLADGGVDLGPFADGDLANTLTLAMEFGVFDFIVGRFLTTAESGWNETTRTFS